MSETNRTRIYEPITPQTTGRTAEIARETAAVPGVDADTLQYLAVALHRAFRTSWQTLTLLEQLAVLLDFEALAREERFESKQEAARIYASRIGAGLKTYARCQIINLRQACEAAR